MLPYTLTALFVLLSAFRTTLAQSTNSSTACNNSLSLCNRAYNKVSHLGAHNSPFVRDESNGYSLSGNQYFNSSTQLSAGVRLLTAQVQTNSDSGELHVCHTSCALLDAGKLSDWLGEVNGWLEDNPSDVVTVLLVNGAGASASELAAEYETAGIGDIAYTPTSSSSSSASSSASNAASSSSDWPTLQNLIDQGTRMVNFVADLDDNSGASYLLNQYDYVFENDYNNVSPSDFSCDASRPASVVNDAQQALYLGLMPLMNHFLYAEVAAFGIQYPNTSYITTTNAPSGGTGNLGASASRCSSEYGRAPTFIVVDFFNVGPAIETVDSLNGVTNPVGRATVSEEVMGTSSAATTSAATVTTLPHRYALMLCLTLLAITLFVA
ncbi:hypothetical protein KC332_g11572 [Hortaea werneckii]|uniref:Phosphatidylinositol-specific phospholipase C X domain-containing protein n=2 Tax=Hortaea werneckii TaxID=91943 RepID=A0A3M7I851_HORWE|nr:hypothetical protein KC358_g11577 [Hortaea werneckii]OTA33213.1 hypothetical protein BTJ68_07051 [Hortaea werneckii EXF-2000]KAI6813904.1 hypothetical protein KC350_g11456 [Hortaea werneckii]KAI6915406.1 hypothetical protein KC348_g12053 [Hortaea werneckii]KAI6921781.1 hypothetical protein KC341_g15736 [Hortaea werneckii]